MRKPNLAQFRAELQRLVMTPVLADRRDPRIAAVAALATRELTGRPASDDELANIIGAATPAKADADAEGGAGPIYAGLTEPVVVSAGKGRGIAWIPVRGMALYEWDYQPFCFSTLLLAARVREFAANADIGTIVLDINSPGGVVTGTPEAGDAIFQARADKRVVALANPQAASAAYWIAASAGEIIATPSASVGSVGVFMLHMDLSGMLEQIGVKPTFIQFGPYKTEGNPFEPLSDDGRAFYQSEVDAIGAAFHKAVARGRELPVATVARDFGGGRSFRAIDAKPLKMVDRVEPVGQTMLRLGVAGGPEDDAPTSRRRLEAGATTTTRSLGLVLHQEIAETEPDENGFRQIVQTGKKTVTLDMDAWPTEIAVSKGVLDAADAKYIKRTGDEIVVTLDNGTATYKIVEQDDDGVKCQLVTCTLDKAPATDPAAIPPAATPVTGDPERRGSEVAAARRRRLALLRY